MLARLLTVLVIIFLLYGAMDFVFWFCYFERDFIMYGILSFVNVINVRACERNVKGYSYSTPVQFTHNLTLYLYCIHD